MKKRALITGASRGIGEAVARRLAFEGYDLCLVCKNSIEKLRLLAGELKAESGISCEAYACDVSDPQQVISMLQQAGQIDVLIHNAGISHIGLLSDMLLEEWNRVIDTNLNSCFYLSHELIPQMVHRKEGKLLFVSSVWGNVGASMEVAYSASKGGINSFTRALAKELAPSNIQVNAIACGAIDTDMNAFLSEEERASLIEEIPAGRLGTPAEVGSLVQSLCSDSGYLTGQVIQLDGGWI